MPRYITPDGYRKLAGELERLWKVERPRVTRSRWRTRRRSATAPRTPSTSTARSGCARSTAACISSASGSRSWRWCARRPSGTDSVYFGAWVALEGEDGESLEFRIVGADEFDPALRFISVESPMARAVLGKRVGDEVVVVRPKGTGAFTSCGCGSRGERRGSGDAMSVCAITGSASGIGAAIRRRLEKDGARVIGIDLRDAEVVADLAQPGGPRGGGRGRARALRRPARPAGGRGRRRLARAPAARWSLRSTTSARSTLLDGLLRGAARGHRSGGAGGVPRTRRRWRASTRARTCKALLAHDEAEARRIADAGRQLDPRLHRREARALAGGAAARGRVGPRGRAHQRDRAGARAHAAARGRHGRSGDGHGDPASSRCRSGAWPSPTRSPSWPRSCCGRRRACIQGSIYYIDGGSDAELRPDRF